MPRIGSSCWIVVLVGVSLLSEGCSKRKWSSADTGAKAAVTAFYQAVIDRNWSKAYDALHPNERSRMTLEQFTGRATNYLRQLGFEPSGVRVPACEEQGETGIAHVVLTGRTANHHHPFKDAVMLRKDGTVWRIILPAGFGETKRP